jgi:hypothetical protein
MESAVKSRADTGVTGSEGTNGDADAKEDDDVVLLPALLGNTPVAVLRPRKLLLSDGSANGTNGPDFGNDGGAAALDQSGLSSDSGIAHELDPAASLARRKSEDVRGYPVETRSGVQPVPLVYLTPPSRGTDNRFGLTEDCDAQTGVTERSRAVDASGALVEFSSPDLM